MLEKLDGGNQMHFVIAIMLLTPCRTIALPCCIYIGTWSPQNLSWTLVLKIHGISMLNKLLYSILYVVNCKFLSFVIFLCLRERLFCINECIIFAVVIVQHQCIVCLLFLLLYSPWQNDYYLIVIVLVEVKLINQTFSLELNFK